MPRLLTLAAVALLSAPAAAQTGKKVALLVGVNDYTSRRLESLKFAERDVTELAAVLRPAGFACRTLTTVAKDAADRPTRANVTQAVRDAARGLTKHDLLLVFVAGQGLQLVHGNRTDAYFCPADARLPAADTLISLTDMLRTLNGGPAGTALLLVDACRNTFDPHRGPTAGDPFGVNLRPGVSLLLSCSAGELSYESDKLGGGHGLLAHALLDGLRGKAAGPDGEVTWDALAAHVRLTVPQTARRVLPDSPPPHPHFVGSLAGPPVVLVPAR